MWFGIGGKDPYCVHDVQLKKNSKTSDNSCVNQDQRKSKMVVVVGTGGSVGVTKMMKMVLESS